MTEQDDLRSALSSLVNKQPERHPVILGLVSPLGTRKTQLLSSIDEEAARFGYTIDIVKLSQLLDRVPTAPWNPLPGRGEPTYWDERMNAGNKLREDVGNGSALAALAIAEVGRRRQKRARQIVYVLDSLKHPDEVRLLRHVYGDAFWLLAIVTDPSERRDDFGDDYAETVSDFSESRALAEQLITRDEAEDDDLGQHVRDTFAEADAFLSARRGHRVNEEVERFFEGIFGRPFHTPRPEEEAMCFAHEASLRSAAVGRQVGAVLVPKAAAVYVTGTNEVPKPGGGQFWSGDEPDHRDFQLGNDPNPAYISRMLAEFLGRLNTSKWLKGELAGRSGDELLRLANVRDENGHSILSGTRAASIIEFTRCLHAEQAAIANAARQGVSTDNSVLYTTTFPCHECAKFIVGAGIREVVYVEPYPKSLVRQLYRDLIDTRTAFEGAAPAVDAGSANDSKLPFRPFVGFAPRRYNEIFAGVGRQVEKEVAKFSPLTSWPRGAGWSENAVGERELATTRAITDLLLRLYPAKTKMKRATRKRVVDKKATAEAPEVETGASDEGDVAR